MLRILPVSHSHFDSLRRSWCGSAVVPTVIAAISCAGQAQETGGAMEDSGTNRVPPKVERYADAVFSHYDDDADGTLSEAEWRKMSGEPEVIDRDHDGVISLPEYRAHVVAYGQARRPAAPLLPVDEITADRNADGAGATLSSDEPMSASNSGSAEGTQASADSTNGAHSRDTKFYVRPSRGLGKLPGWFLDRDGDGDGQLTLPEFSANSPGRLREFRRLDHNSDGVVTPREATMPREEDTTATRRSAATVP